MQTTTQHPPTSESLTPPTENKFDRVWPLHLNIPRGHTIANKTFNIYQNTLRQLQILRVTAMLTAIFFYVIFFQFMIEWKSDEYTLLVLSAPSSLLKVSNSYVMPPQSRQPAPPHPRTTCATHTTMPLPPIQLGQPASPHHGQGGIEGGVMPVVRVARAQWCAYWD